MRIIEIVSWDSFNPRKDIKTMSWLKLDADIGFSESLFNLTPDAKWLWIFILSFCARKNSARINVDLDYFSFHCGIKKEKIVEYLKVFRDRGMIIEESNTSRARTDTNESERICTDTNGNVTKIREEEIREEEKREEPGRVRPDLADDFLFEYLKTVKSITQDSWIKTYGDTEFIKHELFKAVAWVSNNPNKAPKRNLGQFFSNWLSRAWETHRKTLPSSPGKAQGQDLANEIYQKAIVYGGRHVPRDEFKKHFTAFELEVLSQVGGASKICESPESQTVYIINSIKSAIQKLSDFKLVS